MAESSKTNQPLCPLMANRRRIHAFIPTMVPDHGAAEDPFQETVLLMCSKFDSFTPGLSFEQCPKTSGTSTPWSIPLSEFTSAGVKADSVKKIGIGEKARPVSGATGLIYIDDISYGRSTLQ